MSSVSPVCSLTDEELTVLTSPGVAVCPFLEQLDPAEATVARQVASRSLLVRGIIAPALGEEGWQLAHPVLAAVVQARAGAPAVLVIQRWLGPPVEAGEAGRATCGMRYLHLAGELAVVEDVTADGVHVFGVCPRDRLTDAVAEFLVPADLREAPDGGGVDAAGLAARAPVAGHDPADAVVVAELVVVRAGHVPPPAWVLTVSPAGCAFSCDEGSSFMASAPRAFGDDVAAWLTGQHDEAVLEWTVAGGQ